MAAKDKPPPSVRKCHTQMVKELDELFPDTKKPWKKLCCHVQTEGLLSDSDLGEVKHMFQLFIKLMEKGQIQYGEYEPICDILKCYKTDAEKIIKRYTRLIKEASSETGERDDSTDSNSDTEPKKRKSKRKKDAADRDTDDMPRNKMWRKFLENIHAEAENFLEVFQEKTGCISSLELDLRYANAEFTAQNDIRNSEALRHSLNTQIKENIGENERNVNLKLIKKCIIVSFDITGATHPLHPSALALAERFSTGLKDSSILLTDEIGNPLQIQQDSIKFTMKETVNAADIVNSPMVSIDQAAYCVVTGDNAILTSRLLTSTPITSVTWFRINNDDETVHAIEINKEKYSGGSVESPSLVIGDTTLEDEGRYVCHAENRFGVGKSFSTFLCIFNSDNLETFSATLEAETLHRNSQTSSSSKATSDEGSTMQPITEKDSPVPRFDMATDFTRQPEILKLHTDMVQKLGELFPVKETKWHTILKKVQLLNLLSVADVEEIETMYDLFLSLVQKKDNGITYGEYTSIRTILGTCDPFVEEIIDHYTGLIHAFYKDNLETVLALQAETSQRDNQSSISAKTTSDDESMAQLVTEKVSPDNELISAAACGHTETVTLLLEKGADPDDVAKKITFTSGKDQLTSSKCEEADVNPLYKEKRVKRNECGYPTGPSSFRHEKLKMGCNIGVMNQKVPNLGGTLGPFVRYNGNTSFLTCAHVLFDVAQQDTVDFTYDGSNRIDVVQPALDTSMASGAACGFIQRAIFNPRMHPSIDMAVVTISDESRLPDKGRFANDHSSRYKEAGFKHLPEYNDGSRVLDFHMVGTSNSVVQFGSETHLLKGFLKEDGIQVRPLTTVLGLPQSKNIFRMSGQFEVEGLIPMSNLFMPGDSGAAVFMLNGMSLHCIGMAIGYTSTGNAVVTPIAALLDAVRANADIDLSVFP